MRIISGRWRGRNILSPAGSATRPTADRVRQALFDRLAHAPWGGIAGKTVLDAFAGTGALGLEALSRGATRAWFIEQDRAALAALRSNINSLSADTAIVLPADATHPPRAPAPCDLVFLDPPYAQGFGPRAVAALSAAGWIAPAALIVLELGRDEALPMRGALPELHEMLAERAHGAARITVWRAG